MPDLGRGALRSGKLALRPKRKGEAMEQVSRVIKARRTDASRIIADRKKLENIIEDMRNNGGMLTPNAVWLAVDPHISITSDTAPYLDEISSDMVFQSRFATMEKMLDGWIGRGKTADVSPEVRRNYKRLISSCDPLDLWKANVEDEEVRERLIVSDLGTIMDLDLIFSFARGTKDRTLILEVGGGYGRLAEATLNVFGRSVSYVLVDSVPGSMYYASNYLKSACPNRSIGSYYDGDDFDLDRFDCFILPSWRFEELNVYTYDVCVNIESFQEMSQDHVDYYLSMFDRVTRAGAVQYISNSHDYLFKGQWNYPDHWRKVFCENTPRSWTRHHPTEIFIKGGSDFSAANAAVDAAYIYSNEPADVERYLAKVGARAAMMPAARFFGKRAVRRARRTLPGLSRALDRSNHGCRL
jgi:hypothetical protein